MQRQHAKEDIPTSFQDFYSVKNTDISSDIPLQIQDFLKPAILSKYGCSRQVG
jgi:hypothetical protein